LTSSIEKEKPLLKIRTQVVHNTKAKPQYTSKALITYNKIQATTHGKTQQYTSYSRQRREMRMMTMTWPNQIVAMPS